MIRLHFVVEGQTEETFVNDILAPAFGALSIFADVHCITTGRRKGVVNRGGFVSYHHLRNDLKLWMKQESKHTEARFTTMVDLYRLPNDFPGVPDSGKISDPFGKVELLKNKLAEDIDDSRFIPYIQLHEFEALLFADPKAFEAAFPGSNLEISKLQEIRRRFESAEHINHGTWTAPSKRICEVFPGYAKTSHGLTIAHAIGLDTMRIECKHFDRWISTLSELATTAGS